jgi:bifunctional non-homologous end joining protein LigD
MRKENRKGRLFIDYLRNAYSATSVAPYAIRDKLDAPIATPIEWSEVKDDSLTSQRYTIHNIHQKTRRPNPWASFSQQARSLVKPQQRLFVILQKIKALKYV